MNNVEVVKRWLEEYTASVNKGDYEMFLTFWAENVILLFPNAPIAHGKNTLIDFARPLFEQYDFEADIKNEETMVIDDFAFIRVTFKEKYIPKQENMEQINVDAKGLFLLKRMPDTSWKATHLIFNNNSSSE